MSERTVALWQKQDQHEGDRKRLFTTIRQHVGDGSVLYPGSYVDVAASFAFSAVTYIDVDRRAAKFFSDTESVAEIVASEGGAAGATLRFIHADYTSDPGLASEAFDVLVSLYAGFISEACTKNLRVGGVLLVNASHGDAAMASIDPRYELSGVVTSRASEYRVSTKQLGSYLEPKSPVDVTADYLHERGRGIPYTKSPFAYLFTRAH